MIVADVRKTRADAASVRHAAEAWFSARRPRRRGTGVRDPTGAVNPAFFGRTTAAPPGCAMRRARNLEIVRNRLKTLSQLEGYASILTSPWISELPDSKNDEPGQERWEKC
jgi:hypothetical protein